MIDQSSLSKLQADIHTALKQWHDSNSDTGSLDYLQLFQRIKARGGQNVRQVTNEILYEALDTLATEHQQEAALLRRRFLDGATMYAVANQLNLGESTAYRKQKEALRQLTLIVQEREMQAGNDHQTKLENRLDLPPVVQLIGIEDYLSHLLDKLIISEAPWLVCIEGLGGIGKTALANALIRQPDIPSQFQDIAWVSAKQQIYTPGIGLEQVSGPALRADTLIDVLLKQLHSGVPPTQSPDQKKAMLIELLKKAPYLIVIDNLETLIDYQVLLPTLLKLSNPSKFLLTSRYSLRTHSNVYSLNLEELDQANTIRFLRHEIEERGLSNTIGVLESHLEAVYKVVGGNPLALKLVVGQLSVLSLSQVIENLKQAQGKNIDELYTYIYWQAWHALDAASQHVLLMMPLSQNGTQDQLMHLTKLEKSELNQALQQLATLSLVQIGGNLAERRYSIHRLTETFLLNETIEWKTSV